MKTELSLKGGTSPRNQVITGLGFTVEVGIIAVRRTVASFGSGLLNFFDDALSDFYFRVFRSPRKIFNRVTIVVARRKVHIRKMCVTAEDFVDQAHRLEEFWPVECRNRTHAGDDISHRNVRGALFLDRK